MGKQPKLPSPLCAYTLAEEQGLVSVLVYAKRGELKRKAGYRLRLNPPADALREDGHLFSVAPALDAVTHELIPALLHVTDDAQLVDVVVGNGRVTITVGASKVVPARIEAAITAWTTEHDYTLEEVAIERGLTSRLATLWNDADLFAPPPTTRQKAIGVAMQAKLRSKVRAGHDFARRAGLHTALPTASKATAALKWLSRGMKQLDGPLRAVLGLTEPYQLGAYVNCHPAQRRFEYVLSWEEDEVWLEGPVATVLHEYFGTIEARRICGVLWNGPVGDGTDIAIPRITLTADS